MWTPATRAQHNRDHLRYSSDLTDAEWALIEPVLPKAAATGRPRAWPMREIVNAVLFILRSGCPWRMLPDHFPPRSTVWDWFRRFRDERLFEGLGHRLVLADRERCGRPASPSAAVMDSQTARTCESGGPRGYDGAKRIVGRKRHALVDTDGRLLTVVVGAASVQDRDGAGPLARASRHRFPFVERIFADRGYQGERVRLTSPVPVEIVRPRPGQIGFAVQPRRWVVERTFAWLGRNRRLWKDAETTIASSTAFLHAAAANVLIRRIASAE
jgi:putative transposase